MLQLNLITTFFCPGASSPLDPTRWSSSSREGAFFQTPLEGHLERYGVSTLVFSGCNYPNCPRTSIYEASERDFRVVLARDAASVLYDQGVDELVGIGVTAMDSADIANLIALSQRTSIKDRPLT